MPSEALFFRSKSAYKVYYTHNVIYGKSKSLKILKIIENYEKKLKKVSKKFNLKYIGIILLILVLLISGVFFYVNMNDEIVHVPILGKNYCEDSCTQIFESSGIELTEIETRHGGCTCRFIDGRTANFGIPGKHLKSVN